MRQALRILILGWLAVPALLAAPAAFAVPAAFSVPAVVGESEAVHTLAPGNAAVEGVACDSRSPDARRILVLDGSGAVFVYRLEGNRTDGSEKLNLVERLALPGGPDGSAPAGVRGLSLTMEKERPVLSFLAWSVAKGTVTSQLWRWPLGEKSASVHDLTHYRLGIGEREVFGLSCDGSGVLVSFDASGYADGDLRVRRGIARLAWRGNNRDSLELARHLPDSGEGPSLGVAAMELDGARYLFATKGSDHVYAAEAETGRGLFAFDRPGSAKGRKPCRGLAFGHDALWVPEKVAGAARLHRVNVTRNLDARREGPRVLRRLVMTISTAPEESVSDPGAVFHYYARPYAYEQLGNQGIWPETERVSDLSGVPTAAIRLFHHDPGGDAASRQWMQCVTYPAAEARSCSSRYEIDLWTNRCRTFVYPHRVNRKAAELKGTDYLADDPDLFNLHDRETYSRFFDRVRAHVESKYGVGADMENPYWAARNALEYIQDHYYYPSWPKGIPAAVDYDRRHYDANPGNLKIALSDRPYDKTQIIACSGTSVMMAGAMRSLGIPARWLGTGTETGPKKWDDNGNGLLDREEAAACTNGHRYTQVWLGDRYGWTCFDATPSVPPFKDYDPPPPLRSQWRYMSRAAAGHMRDRRIVFNVGSGLFRPLYRDFEYDAKLAVNNNCGGDQRYNLQGRFEKPELWKLAKHRIRLKNLCFVTAVARRGPKAKTRVTWKLEGAWGKDPGARLSLFLQRVDAGTGRAKDVALLAEGIPCDAGAATVDLSPWSGRGFRVILRKEGDAETGGDSAPFDLE